MICRRLSSRAGRGGKWRRATKEMCSQLASQAHALSLAMRAAANGRDNGEEAHGRKSTSKLVSRELLIRVAPVKDPGVRLLLLLC